MSNYGGGGLMKSYSTDDDYERQRKKRKRKRKIIIASTVSGGSIAAIVLAIVLLTSTVAFGAMGLRETDPIIISNSLRLIQPISDEPYDYYDNSPLYPTPGDQGQQSSCTAWATVYALKGAQEGLDHKGINGFEPIFSPAYVYNQINGGQDGGSYIHEAMELITNEGVCLLEDMPYDDQDYLTQPNDYQKDRAYAHSAWKWFGVSGVDQIKEAIVQYQGVVMGVSVYPDFNELNEKNPVYDVQRGQNYGGHAICLVGFDDSIGAFKFINSWSEEWGLDGYGWVSYDIVNAESMKYGAFCMEDWIENNF